MQTPTEIRNGRLTVDADVKTPTTAIGSAAMSFPARSPDESTSPMLLRELMKPKRQAIDQRKSPTTTTTIADCSVSMFSLKDSGMSYVTGGFRRPPKTTSGSPNNNTNYKRASDANHYQQVRGLHCATAKRMNEMNDPGIILGANGIISTDRFLCGICKSQFSDLKDFLVHKSSHKNIAGNTIKIRCELCETYFASQANLITHYKVDHVLHLPPVPDKLEIEIAYHEDIDRSTAEPIIVISEDEDAEDKAAQTKSPTKSHTRTKRTKKKRGMHWTRRKLHVKQQKTERTLQELHDNDGDDPMTEPEDGCYPCPVCGMVFDRLMFLDKHTALHNGLQKIVFGGNGSSRDLPMDLSHDPSLASQRLRRFAESAKQNGGVMPADCLKASEGEFFDPLGVCQVLLDVAEDPEDVPYVTV